MTLKADRVHYNNIYSSKYSVKKMPSYTTPVIKFRPPSVDLERDQNILF